MGIGIGGYYKNEFSIKMNDQSEKDLSRFVIGEDGKTVVINSGVITSTSTTPTKKTHSIMANIYNLPVDQQNLFGKNFKAHVTVANLDCTMTDYNETLGYYITNDLYNNTYNLEGVANGEAGIYLHDADLENGANDNTYRYTGGLSEETTYVSVADFNYVCFDGDDCTNENNLYRIISVDSNNNVKVIKATSIGDMAWDSNGENIWEESTLAAYLNGEWLESLGAKANLIEETTWSVGGVDFETYEAGNLKEFADEELNNSKTYKAKIGLMYASDYGYAALPEYWLNSINSFYQINWLVNENQWTISNGDFDEVIFAVGKEGQIGYVEAEFFIDTEMVVRPCFNLKSNVKIINAGDEDVGSKDVPMIISSAKYWNDNFGGKYYTHPNTPSIAYGRVAELQAEYSNFLTNPVYIKTTDKEHLACLYYNNKEFCLSKGYWETNEETTKEKLKEAMEEVLGISIDICNSNSNITTCYVGGFYCYARDNGVVGCGGGRSGCHIDVSSKAGCR